jgi:putative peptidoglycan lipid II flippase
MFAPIVNNVVAIATYVAFIAVAGTATAGSGTLTAQQTAWLGIGTTLGVAMQAIVLIPVLSRTGYRFAATTRWRGLGLTKAVRLAGWTIALVVANQVGFLVTSRLATGANVNALAAGEPAAGLATYQTGYLIFILPHSVITVSIVTALLPTLSRTVHAGRLREAGSEISRASRIIMLLIAPVAVSLFLAAGPVASLLFGYGAASAEQIAELGAVTRIFALGILPFTVYYVLLRGWYANEDTRTPFYLALLLNLVTIVLSLIGYSAVDPGPWQIYMLAVAFVIGYWVNLVVAWPILSRRYGGLDTSQTVRQFAKVFLSGAAALGAGILVQQVTAYQPGGTKLQAAVDIVAVSTCVLAVYVGVVALLRIREGRDLWHMAAARLGRG